jgi:hypothetical protein
MHHAKVSGLGKSKQDNSNPIAALQMRNETFHNKIFTVMNMNFSLSALWLVCQT